MKCEYCDNEVPVGSSRCPNCGAAVKVSPIYTQSAPAASFAQTAPQMQAGQAIVGQAKTRSTYQLLAFFLGTLGVHNFYAGYTGRAIAQLLIPVLSGGTCIFVSGIWAFIELFVVKKDARGIPFA